MNTKMNDAGWICVLSDVVITSLCWQPEVSCKMPSQNACGHIYKISE